MHFVGVSGLLRRRGKPTPTPVRRMQWLMWVRCVLVGVHSLIERAPVKLPLSLSKSSSFGWYPKATCKLIGTDIDFLPPYPASFSYNFFLHRPWSGIYNWRWACFISIFNLIERSCYCQLRHVRVASFMTRSLSLFTLSLLYYSNWKLILWLSPPSFLMVDFSTVLSLDRLPPMSFPLDS